jgi:PKD repeat protein
MACDYIARVDNPNGHIIFDDYFQDQGAATPRVRAAGQVVINNAHLAAEYFTLDVPAGGRFECSNSILLQMPDMSQAGTLNYGTNNSIIGKSFITSMDHSGDTSQLPCYSFGVAMDTNNLQAAWAPLQYGTRDSTVRGVTGLVLASGSNFVCHVTDPRFTNAPKQIIEVYYLDGDTTVTGTLLVKYRNTGGTMTTAMTIDPNPGSSPGINSSSKTVTDAQFLGGTNWDIVLTATGTSPVVLDVIVTANSTTPYLGLPPQLVTPPVAQFTGTPTNEARPLAVTFTDQSTGSITNLLWNFGDAQTTNTIGGAVVSHSYTNAGSYTVSLIASGSAGSSTNTKTSYITVNVPTSPNIGSISLVGTTALLLQGTGGPTNGTYYYWLRSSTNIALPLTNWSIVATNPFNADGTFSNQIPLIPGITQTFYRLQMP